MATKKPAGRAAATPDADAADTAARQRTARSIAWAEAAAGNDDARFVQLLEDRLRAPAPESAARSAARARAVIPIVAQPAPQRSFQVHRDPRYLANARQLARRTGGGLRVIGGVDVAAGEFLDCVAVGSDQQWGCTGTLIAPNVVVTAGHCADFATRIYIGRDVSKKGKVVKVAQRVRHPKYNLNGALKFEVQHILFPDKVAQMTNKYTHLNSDNRAQLQTMLAQGLSMRRAAAALAVSPSTVSREVKRAGAADGGWYLAVKGDRARSAGRVAAGGSRRKLGSDMTSPCWRVVFSGLNVGWSPEQIAGRLKLAPPSNQEASLRVSHETIYSAIYTVPRGALRTELVKMLRQSRAGRRTRARGTSRFTGVQEMTPIALRPPEVCARIVPGHWEGDLIKGASNGSAVGTLVERTSRYVMLVKLEGAGAMSVLDGFTRRLRTVPESLRKTMTYDQGTEMALHQTLASRLHMNIYFCDPHSPWQRGSNENANGLIREYLPKGTDLSEHSHQRLASIEASLNNRPRKILGYRTPAEVFSELKLHQVQGVALQA